MTSSRMQWSWWPWWKLQHVHVALVGSSTQQAAGSYRAMADAHSRRYEGIGFLYGPIAAANGDVATTTRTQTHRDEDDLHPYAT